MPGMPRYSRTRVGPPSTLHEWQRPGLVKRCRDARVGKLYCKCGAEISYVDGQARDAKTHLPHELTCWRRDRHELARRQRSGSLTWHPDHD